MTVNNPHRALDVRLRRRAERMGLRFVKNGTGPTGWQITTERCSVPDRSTPSLTTATCRIKIGIRSARREDAPPSARQ
jgi:hypothetical protein